MFAASHFDDETRHENMRSKSIQGLNSFHEHTTTFGNENQNKYKISLLFYSCEIASLRLIFPRKELLVRK